MKARFVRNTDLSIEQNGVLTYDSSTAQTGIYQNDGGIKLAVPGVYLILSDITATASSADPIIFSIITNGSQMEGATASVTPVSGDLVNIHIQAMVSVFTSVNTGYATLNIVNSGASTTVNNASVIIMEV